MVQKTINSRSPFYIISEFISPLMCEDIIDLLNFTVPDKDTSGHYVPTMKTSDRAEQILYERMILATPELTTYYNVEYKGMERMSFEWYPEGSNGNPVCGNSEYIRKQWMRTNARDFTGILFLSDFHDGTSFDSEYEVYGGKLEFMQHKFSFNPTRGTLVVFPSDPHFINATSTALVGDAYQVRMHFTCKVPFIYDPRQFPGNYTTWFKDIM